MKTTSILVLGLVVWASANLQAADTPAGTPRNEPSPPANTAPAPQEAPTPVDPNLPVGAAVNAAAPEANPAGASVVNGTNGGLRLNFRGAPLDAVLEYMSDAAGFIIVKEARVRGTVDVWSNQPLSKDEAVNLLNSVLKKNGLAAIRNGRTLTIINRDEAKTHDIPVISGSDPEKIPRNDEIVTQIIPVRFVEVKQLVVDLQPLVSTQSTITANEAGNAIVITDTQANIRRIAEIILAIDSGAEDFTTVRVFRLSNSDPMETADLLTNLFPDDSRSGSNSQSPFQSGFSRFFGGRSSRDGGNNNNNSQTNRLKKRNRVIAVADQRTASVIVSASRDLMEQIEGVVMELDSNRKGRQTVHVYELRNASPQETLPVLQDMFSKSGTQNNRNTTSQNDPLLNRSTTQNQQNNTGINGNNGMSRGGLGGGGGGGGGGISP